MNIEGLREIQQWLRNGSPHIEFDMETGVTVERPGDGGKGYCNTSCCIAGYAAQLATPLPDLVEVASMAEEFDEDGRAELCWDEVMYKALAYLDLEQTLPVFEMGHPLFNTIMAPSGVTPDEAIQAIENLIDGAENPWDGVREKSKEEFS